MSTSGVASMTATRDIIVRRALRMVGAFTSTDNPRPEQMTDAITVLNMMLKAWSIEGLLWLRDFVTIPLVAGQSTYSLGPATLPNPIDRPLHVFNAVRRNTGGYDVPLTILTRTDYLAIPNKSSQGVVVQVYYDAKTTNGILYVWPTPSTTTASDDIVLDVDRQIDIMTDDTDDFDFPPQWLEAITYGLASRIAPEYGLPISERDKLKEEAGLLFMVAVNDDREIASVKIGVRKSP